MREIDYRELSINPMTLIAKTWWLIGAGNEESGYNAMTASWGHLGSIWGTGGGSPTAVIYIRPQRFTKQFVDREERFTLSVMDPEKYRDALTYMGRRSGREGDKFEATGLTPLFTDGTTAVAEADMVFVCRKLYRAPMTEAGFVDKSIVDAHYQAGDFHDMYIGLIEKVLVKD